MLKSGRCSGCRTAGEDADGEDATQMVQHVAAFLDWPVTGRQAGTMPFQVVRLTIKDRFEATVILSHNLWEMTLFFTWHFSHTSATPNGMFQGLELRELWSFTPSLFHSIKYYQ